MSDLSQECTSQPREERWSAWAITRISHRRRIAVLRSSATSNDFARRAYDGTYSVAADISRGFLETARKVRAIFEQRQREFAKRKAERAAQLHLAIGQNSGPGPDRAALPIMKGTYVSRLYLLSSCRSLGCWLIGFAGGGCS